MFSSLWMVRCLRVFVRVCPFHRVYQSLSGLTVDYAYISPVVMPCAEIANQSPDDLVCPWTQFVYLHNAFRKLQISGVDTDTFRFPGSFEKPEVLPTVSWDSYVAAGGGK